MPKPEALARETIDEALQLAGWTIQDAKDANVDAGPGVAVREFPLGRYGFADYLLCVNGKAAGVIEAKKAGTPLTGVEPQTERYSQGLPRTVPAHLRPLPFLYQSTGVETPRDLPRSRCPWIWTSQRSLVLLVVVPPPHEPRLDLLTSTTQVMRTHTISRQLTALLLSILLASCGTTAHLAHPNTEEFDLTHSVLIIRELPDGRVVHAWQNSDDFDLSRFKHMPSASAANRRIVLAMAPKRDCDAELQKCMKECMGKGAYCSDQCRQPYLDCMRLQELKPQEFTAVDDAVDWLKRNHKAVLLGTVIIIAGVAFVVVSAGTGLVILAPAVLLASSSSLPSSCAAEVLP